VLKDKNNKMTKTDTIKRIVDGREAIKNLTLTELGDDDIRNEVWLMKEQTDDITGILNSILKGKFHRRIKK